MVMKDMRGAIIPPENYSKGIPPVVIVTGTNYEMGYQYSEQLAPKIYSLLKRIQTSCYTVYEEKTVINDMRVQLYFSEKYTPGFKEWLKGMSDGCKTMGYEISVEEMMLIACFTSEFYERPTGDYPEETKDYLQQFDSKRNPKDNERNFCTSFAVSGKNTADGKAIVAGIGGSAFEAIDRVILMAFPKEGYSYITCSTIGKNHDQLCLNTSGLGWVFTGNYSGPCDWSLMPELVFHHLCQYSSGIKDVEKYIESLPRCGAFANFTMGDSKGNISGIESNHYHFVTRKPGDLGEPAEYFVITNHFAAPGTEDWNIEINGASYKEWNYPSITRFATADAFLKEYTADKKMDIEHVRMMYSSDDWFDPVSKKWVRNDPGTDAYGSNLGYDGFDYTVQSAIVPEDMMIYIMQGTGSGTGMPAGSQGQFIEIKMSDSPAEIAADMEIRTFDIFRAARRELRIMINGNECLKKNYLLREKFETILDECYIAYELGQDRRAYAFMEIHDGATDKIQTYRLLAEAMSHFAVAQVKGKKLLYELKVYIGKD